MTHGCLRLVRLLHWIFLNSARLGLKPGSQPASRATAPRPPPTRRRFFAWRPPVPLAKKGQLVGYHHISICQLSEPYGKFITVLHKVVVGMCGRKEVGVALGVGIVGSGFIARFHVLAWQSVRGADITAICSRNAETAADLAELARQLGVGDPRIYSDPAELARDARVDAIWLCSPNYLRVEQVGAIAGEVTAGRAELVGLACEKPLARNLREAREVVRLVEQAGLLHGYLENQVFAPALARGKEILWDRAAQQAGAPYLARAAEEHGGPHRAWFWDPTRQGGGVLSDMMCHTVEVTRKLLTKPGEPSYLTPRSVSAQIAALKWTQPRYAEELLAT